MAKACKTCGLVKALEEFRVGWPLTEGGKQPDCKPCQDRRWFANSLKALGTTVEAYERALIEQEGVCAICLSLDSSGRRLAQDHNHTTGAVRGLLCGKCNRGLGHFFDDISLLERAIQYLKKWR